MLKVETERSIYFFDEGGRYCRMPRNEIEREPFERQQQIWSGGPMDDAVWNELVDVQFCRHPLANEQDNDSLNIRYPGATWGIETTPILDASMDTAREIVGQHKHIHDND